MAVINTIPQDEHVFIAGMTGTGKSFFAEAYLAGYPYVIKLDTKGEIFERRKKGEAGWRGLVEGKDYTVIERLADINNVTTPKIIYAPHFTEQTEEYYDSLCKYIYERENTTFWIDELMSIADSPRKYPLYLKALYTRGRSKDVGIWALTQRPVDVPVIAGANSKHFITFDLAMPQDRQKMAEITGCPNLLEMPKGYNFWYFKLGWETAVKGVLVP